MRNSSRRASRSTLGSWPCSATRPSCGCFRARARRSISSLRSTRPAKSSSSTPRKACSRRKARSSSAASFSLSSIRPRRSASTMPADKRLPCYVYVDECHNYIKNDPKIQVILAEARQQKVGVILAHQFLDQIDPPVRAALTANTGIKMAARLDAGDRAAMARDMNTVPDFITRSDRRLVRRLHPRSDSDDPFDALPQRTARALRPHACRRGADRPRSQPRTLCASRSPRQDLPTIRHQSAKSQNLQRAHRAGASAAAIPRINSRRRDKPRRVPARRDATRHAATSRDSKVSRK